MKYNDLQDRVLRMILTYNGMQKTEEENKTFRCRTHFFVVAVWNI